jgi:ferredoxin
MLVSDSQVKLEKLEPMSRGRTDLRKRKPKQLAIINENCTGCAGSPVCVDYCPVEACMFWIPDEEHPPFGRIEVDKTTCIGCAKCTSKGPDGMFLDGCPWNAIEMVSITDWEAERNIQLPDQPDRPVSEWWYVRSEYV